MVELFSSCELQRESVSLLVHAEDTSDTEINSGNTQELHLNSQEFYLHYINIYLIKLN